MISQDGSSVDDKISFLTINYIILVIAGISFFNHQKSQKPKYICMNEAILIHSLSLVTFLVYILVCSNSLILKAE